MEMIQNFYKDTSGATMVEYALVITFIALVCFSSVNLLGSSVANTFSNSTLMTGVGS
jgi:Flp pilus assembly pilin Flp